MCPAFVRIEEDCGRFDVGHIPHLEQSRWGNVLGMVGITDDSPHFKQVDEILHS